MLALCKVKIINIYEYDFNPFKSPDRLAIWLMFPVKIIENYEYDLNSA